MNEKYKKLVHELGDILIDKSEYFIICFLSKECEADTSDLINLVLSSHISSICTLMNTLSIDNVLMNKKVKLFIKNLLCHIETITPIEKVEIIE